MEGLTKNVVTLFAYPRVHILSVPDLHHANGQNIILYLAKYAVISLPNPVLGIAAQHFCLRWPWLILQGVNALQNTPHIVIWDFAQVFPYRVLESDSISCHRP